MNGLPVNGLPVFPMVGLMWGRGRSSLVGGLVVAEQLLPTDPLGTMTLTLKGMVSGSRWRLELLSTGALVAEGDATGADALVVLPYYQPNQTLRLKVRKGTASPYYRPFDTQATIGSASASIFVSQISDE